MIKAKALSALEKAIDEKHEQDRAAIRHVLKLLKQHGISPTGARLSKEDKEQSESASNGHNGASGAENRIHAAIANTSGHFTLADLTKELPDINRSTISGVLYRESGKRIKVIVKGQGRRVGIYEKM